MSDNLDVIAIAIGPPADSDAVAQAAVEFTSLRNDGSPRTRPGRRSGYCAETAWVWQRARFLCAKSE
jgi:hypothetical protein